MIMIKIKITLGIYPVIYSAFYFLIQSLFFVLIGISGCGMHTSILVTIDEKEQLEMGAPWRVHFINKCI